MQFIFATKCVNVIFFSSKSNIVPPNRVKTNISARKKKKKNLHKP